MSDNKLHLGLSPITGKIYLGRQKGLEFVGEKRDVTSEFISIMLQKFPPNEDHVITVNGQPKYHVLIIDQNADVTITYKDESTGAGHDENKHHI